MLTPTLSSSTSSPFVYIPPLPYMNPTSDSSNNNENTSSSAVPDGFFPQPVSFIPSYSQLSILALNNDRNDILNILSAYASSQDPLETMREKQDNISYSKLVRFANSHKISLIKKQPRRNVGELHEKWQFPSDHLPIGAQVDDFYIASFNALNDLYLSWVTEQDSQGLNESLITDLCKLIDPITHWCHRNIAIAQLVMSILYHPTHPKSVIALQECSPEFIECLKMYLPFPYTFITSQDKYLLNQQILIYDTNLFECKSQNSSYSYPSDPKKPLLETVLVHKETAKSYQFFNVHIPGDPSASGVKELARHVISSEDPTANTIIIGDTNFLESEIESCFKEASGEAFPELFEIWGSYNTNISPRTDPTYPLWSKRIDHIIVFGKNKPAIMDSTPYEVFVDLQKMVDLL